MRDVVRWGVSLVMAGVFCCNDIATYRTMVGDGVVWHFVAMFLHGNVWHLLGNVLVLWLLRRPLYLWQGVVIGYLCSWLPAVPGVWDIFGGWCCNGIAAYGTMVTVGFSGVLFGMVGVKWGVWARRKIGRDGIATYWTMVRRMGPFLTLGALLPGVNWCLHVYCFVVGVVWGMRNEK